MSLIQHPLPRRVVRILVLTWILFFVLGTCGHLQLGNTVPDSLFKALQLFHLHYHPHPETGTADQGTPDHQHVGWAIEVSRFGCALWGLAILPALLGLIFRRRVRGWWVATRWKKHHVVCGNCARTRSLIEDLARRGEQVVWIGRCAESEPVLPPKAFHLEGDAGDPAVLAKAGAARAAQLVALHEEDRLNLEILVAAGRLCEHRPPDQAQLEAYAHVTDTRLRHSLRTRTETGRGFAGKRVHEHLFNYYELIARLLARRFPLPPTLAEAPPPPEHIIIVGFAAFGQCAALRIMLMSQQLYRQAGPEGVQWGVAKPRITVVDPDAEARVAEFVARHPAFGDYCRLESCALSTSNPAFRTAEVLTQREAGERKTLIFCIESEEETLRIAQLIADLAAAAPKAPVAVDRVFFRLARPERLDKVLATMWPPGSALEVVWFAADSEVFNAPVLLNQKLDLLAREVHKAWLSVEADDRRANNLPPAAGKKWEQLSEDDRESNREAADHMWAKLHVLGYRLAEVAKGDPAPAPDPQLLLEIKSHEEDLARAEHYRWMTWRILRNWKWGKVRDNNRREHPDIVDYDLLAETTKAKDRVIVRVIPELLRQGQLTASRRERL